MIRIFQSPWFAAGFGCLLYLGTTAAILNPSKFASFRPPAPDYSAENDPSWKFRNPEIDQWLSQMKNEKDKLDSRQEQLNELQTRLNAELQEISTATQTVSQLQDNFNRDVIRFKAQETDNVKHQTKLMSAMSPDGAIAMLKQMPDDDAVRILFTMKNDVASAILDSWSKESPEDARRAAQLTQKLREVLPTPTPATTTP